MPAAAVAAMPLDDVALGGPPAVRTVFDVDSPRFLTALSVASAGKTFPVIGGVLIRDAAGELVGALGVTGDSGDNDERVAVAAIEQCGFKADLS